MFEKICIIEPVFITDKGINQLKMYCDKLVCYDSSAQSEEELIKRISDADCILVSQKTAITKKIIDACVNLKFICMCCSFYGKEYSKVDVEYAQSKNIKYAYLHKYGDNGVVEYTVASVINLQHGLNGKKYCKEFNDLTETKVGILGLGDLGYRVAKAFMSLGAKVYYYSKTRKIDYECDSLKYLSLEDLLKTVNVLSINLNRDVCLIGNDKLKLFGDDKIIINMSLGNCYDIKTLKEWLKYKNNFYVCDKASINNDFELIEYENVVYTNRITGVTKQTLETATRQIINNIEKFLKENKA